MEHPSLLFVGAVCRKEGDVVEQPVENHGHLEPGD
jgi:hypothetical protein